MAVRLAVRVEVALGAHAVARAAVARLVHVEAVLAPGDQAVHRAHHAHLVSDLVEVDGAGGLVALGGLKGGGCARGIRWDALAAGEARGSQNNQDAAHYFFPSLEAANFL
jgi:hypothetical protein